MNVEQPDLPRELGDGLLLRWATAADAERVAAFNANIHADAPDRPATSVGAWTADLMSGRHPTVRPTDFTVVEDTIALEEGAPKLVSTLALLSQTWSYDGIEFGVGQPELVGTLPGYRRRGLIRAQMDAVHSLSASRGELLQGITGIPWYYRKFGYEMTVNLSGSRTLLWGRPKQRELKPNGAYSVRDADVEDIPNLQELYARGVAHSRLRLIRSDANWRYMLTGQSPQSDTNHSIRLVEDEAGQVFGYFMMEAARNGAYVINEAAVAEGNSLRELGLFIAQTLLEESRALASDEPVERIVFGLGEYHPLYQAMGRNLERLDEPYAWYIRVPDVAAFLAHVRPALEARLAASVMAGHSGDLKLNFFDSQLKLRFERGKLAAIDAYEPNDFYDGDAFFPDLTFLHLLFGHRTLAELNYIRKDCWSRNVEVVVLLGCLFPKQSGYVGRAI